MIALLALAVLGASARIAVPAEAQPSRARYVATREDTRGLALPSHVAWGWSQRARLLPDGSTELTVVSEPRRPPGRAAAPHDDAAATRAVRAATDLPEEVRLLSGELVLGASDSWEASHRVLTWVSLNVRHEDEPGHGESSAETLRARVASCVGRSRLAADLLLAAGIPARTVHGLLAQPGRDREFLLHRFVETWIDGLGWVPSDPGESIHVVDARHVFLAVEGDGYDPEAQRGLRLRTAEAVAEPLGRSPGGGLRPLIVRERPRGGSVGRRAP